MTDEDLKYLEVAIRTSHRAVFDLETTGLDEHATTGGRSHGGIAARIVKASFTLDLEDSNRVANWVLPLSHPQSPFLGMWRETITSIAKVLREEKIDRKSSRLNSSHV